MTMTKTFISGNSQAVRIPKEYRIEQEDVIINKIGNTIFIYPVEDRYEMLMDCLNGFSDDFFPNGRLEQPEYDEREIFD